VALAITVFDQVNLVAASVANPPRRARSRRPTIVDTMHSKYHEP
jgi:hypothetical protein